VTIVLVNKVLQSDGLRLPNNFVRFCNSKNLLDTKAKPVVVAVEFDFDPSVADVLALLLIQGLESVI